jgi:hypothetical protein
MYKAGTAQILREGQRIPGPVSVGISIESEMLDAPAVLQRVASFYSLKEMELGMLDFI